MPESTASTTLTVLGLGSLLSERSSRTTYPRLTNFRLARVEGYRRVFGHPAGIFFERGIANAETKEFSSLCAEPCAGASFICTVFETPNDSPEEWAAFVKREEEFQLVTVPYRGLDGSTGEGLLCCRSTDDAYIKQWGQERFDAFTHALPVKTIWGYAEDSGLRPCAVYLRHCCLAAQKLGDVAYASFLDETYLADRKTTLRSYLAEPPEVLTTEPPESLRERYGG